MPRNVQGLILHDGPAERLVNWFVQTTAKHDVQRQINTPLILIAFTVIRLNGVQSAAGLAGQFIQQPSHATSLGKDYLPFFFFGGGGLGTYEI